MKPLVTIDEMYDRENASDGVSRFGSYVRQRAHLFVEDWEPLSPVTFAATVWSIATSPVMAPPYARMSPQVWSVDCYHGDEPGVLVVDIEARLRWPLEYRDDDALAGWVDWARLQCRYDDEVQLLDPMQDRTAALFAVQLRIPIIEDSLPSPCRFGSLDVAVAKCAVSTIANHVNALAGPVVAQLREDDAVGPRR